MTAGLRKRGNFSQLYTPLIARSPLTRRSGTAKPAALDCQPDNNTVKVRHGSNQLAENTANPGTGVCCRRRNPVTNRKTATVSGINSTTLAVIAPSTCRQPPNPTVGLAPNGSAAYVRSKVPGKCSDLDPTTEHSWLRCRSGQPRYISSIGWHGPYVSRSLPRGPARN